MKVTEPESMAELCYMTIRTIGDTGKVRAWARRAMCPKCNKAKMGKPRGKAGKVKIRSKEYHCPECEYIVEKEEYEDTLTVEAMYTCPHCGKDGSGTAPFKRQKIRRADPKTGKKKSIDCFRIPCEHCGESIDITKKMK
jgi:hypothetical protein